MGINTSLRTFSALGTLLFIFKTGRKKNRQWRTEVKKNKEHLRHWDKTHCSLSPGQHQPSVALNSLKIVNSLWHIDYLTAAEKKKKKNSALSSSPLHTFWPTTTKHWTCFNISLFISFTLTARTWAQFKQEHINDSINDARLRRRASGEMVLMSEQMWCHDSQMTFSSAINERVVIFFFFLALWFEKFCWLCLAR